MKVSVSLPDEDIEFLDAYARSVGARSRSAVLQRAVRLLRATELGPAYDEVHRLLRPGGWYILIGYHPFFLLTGVPTHFQEEGQAAVAIRNHVHLLSDHASAGLSRGWALQSLRERVVDEDWVASNPNWSRHLHKPASFAMVWQK